MFTVTVSTCDDDDFGLLAFWFSLFGLIVPRRVLVTDWASDIEFLRSAKREAHTIGSLGGLTATKALHWHMNMTMTVELELAVATVS